jgi:hypothetical protein
MYICVRPLDLERDRYRLSQPPYYVSQLDSLHDTTRMAQTLTKVSFSTLFCHFPLLGYFKRVKMVVHA